ncbi:hypothetical protein ACVMBY_006379 [Bradyrhizobium huanghuaihaiense]|uniref:Uncharacterized protein n=1 Tax=Bradyrhizobium huanghuaihaiense TaxID=990078 RepID=A0A562RIX7_9BRAD|nr:hypothetical protein [Bradyrhizobium huanghuaihaiense]TWI68326.1 hypothetical protein IQ16_04170 [Bradyrhizobium huanghuaihaiense]
MLSRLISLLHRIPAVKWALTRLRPTPHGGSIDAAPIAAESSPVLIVDAAETAPAPSISADPPPSAAVVADEAAIPVVAESPSAAPADVNVTDNSLPETPTEAEPVVVAEAAISPVDIAPEPTDVPELIIDNDPPAEDSADVAPDETEQTVVACGEADEESVDAEPIAISSDPSPELPAGIEPVVAEETEVVSVDVAIAPVDALSVNDDHSPGIPAAVEPAVADALCVALGDSEAPVEDVSESGIDNAPSSSVAVEIESVPANDPAPVVAAVVTETSSEDSPGVVADIAPEQDSAPPAPEVRSTPKVRAKPAEPADRAALIRQRWAETGIRMWNPRLHGTGDATLNIQGSIELLPPAPGETLPRYDKLEFRMLGGQIVCEGVIVEAPVQASHRSFTRLAEPRVPDRVRESVRERQAALA